MDLNLNLNLIINCIEHLTEIKHLKNNKQIHRIFVKFKNIVYLQISINSEIFCKTVLKHERFHGKNIFINFQLRANSDSFAVFVCKLNISVNLINNSKHIKPVIKKFPPTKDCYLLHIYSRLLGTQIILTIFSSKLILIEFSNENVYSHKNK